MRRSLIHYWRMNAAVVLSCAVAVAVLTGALVVGDSVRGSLRALTLDRLGSIDQALVSATFFREELASEMARSAGDRVQAVTVAIVMPGGARNPATGARASAVGIQGITESFVDLFPGADLGLEAAAGQGVAINAALAEELGVAAGDAVLLSLERPGDAPRESLLGSTETADVVRQLRLEVTRVLPDSGIGRFSLSAHQILPLVAFVSLDTLQEALEQEGRANTILVEMSGAAEAELLGQALGRVLKLEDLGLEVKAHKGYASITSRDHILSPALEAEIEAFASGLGSAWLRISTYIANSLAAGEKSVPYSAVTAFNTAAREPFGPLRLVNGDRAPALRPGEVLVNTFVAEDLGVGAGDPLTMEYYEVGPREELITRSVDLEVKGVVALEGLGADASLTPEFPGIHDAEDMASWDPPFPVDLSRVRDRDEDYWDAYRATPKAFFSIEQGLDLWATRFGRFTGVRLSPAEGSTVAELVEKVRTEMVAGIEPARVGLAFDPVRERGLGASGGATDFRWLFLSFSSFLIASAAMLVSLFFSLGVEQRASEIGLLLATGFPLRSVRRRFLAEGAALALVGSVLGALVAVGYAGAMMMALRTWWQDAVGTPFLYLHVEPASLVIGSAVGFGVVAVTIWGAVRRMGRLSLVGLLRGVVGAPRGTEKTPRGRRIAWVAGGAGVTLLAVGIGLGEGSSPAIFFGAGGSLLVAGLAWFSQRLREPSGQLSPDAGWVPMAARNNALNPGRSLLSAALVSSAAFVIVAVAANGFRYGEEVRALDSAAGGYSLMAESSIPVYHDLTSEEAAFEFGFPSSGRALLEQSQVTAFRLLPGDDVSCLNLYQPEQPRILGVPPEQLARGGFRFQRLERESSEPWSLLAEDRGEVVPAFGDNESMTWILKKGLGDEVIVENERGEPVRLRLVGLIEKSLFQGELLISEENFKRHFPSRTGYSYFLIDPPAGGEEDVAALLEDRLGDYGFDVTPTTEKLQRFQAVFNTYLATFQTLGGLGLLLGTLGLAAILLRNVLERRGELATLRALGFRRSSLARLVVTENALLLFVGVGIGAAAALLSVSPHLLAGNALVPWGSLVAILALIVGIGMLASIAAVNQALKSPLLPALKGD